MYWKKKNLETSNKNALKIEFYVNTKYNLVFIINFLYRMN